LKIANAPLLPKSTRKLFDPMPSTQKALILTKKFGDLVIDEISVPKPGAGEVLVKIIATSLNPVDWKIQKYGIFFEDYPAILGTDVSGEVEEVGEGVIEFKKGDRVYVLNWHIF
jgi:NADPH:quinone reductase-like Zn-dependent oxidoreductase